MLDIYQLGFPLANLATFLLFLNKPIFGYICVDLVFLIMNYNL